MPRRQVVLSENKGLNSIQIARWTSIGRFPPRAPAATVLNRLKKLEVRTKSLLGRQNRSWLDKIAPGCGHQDVEKPTLRNNIIASSLWDLRDK